MPAIMRGMGLEAVGLEPYEHACQMARERYGLEVICATLQEADLPESSFDAVTFFDVLEHVHDPVADVRRACELLRPGGFVYIKVPNIGALQASLFGPWWYWLDTPRHLFHFSPRSLRRALEVAGFQDIDCRALPDWQGAMVFETSVVYWLRGLQLRRLGVTVAPQGDQTVGDALEGKVYSGVPSIGKRAFRWLVRNVAYLPFAVENLIGRSVTLLATGRRP
jgi:SAM-dependent methyltransferase